jgi:hypothetical protein
MTTQDYATRISQIIQEHEAESAPNGWPSWKR